MAYQTKPLSTNIVSDTDSYKHGHAKLLNPLLNSNYEYIEARVGGNDSFLAWAGIQAIVAQNFVEPITKAHIDEAREVSFQCHGHDVLDLDAWTHVLNTHGGTLPMRIKIVPEGTILEKGNALLTAETSDPIFAKLLGSLEPTLMHSWYPSAVLTRDAKIKSRIYPYFLKTGCLDQLDWAVHDFGLRGTTCLQHGEIGGLAHMIAFRGSDNLRASRAVNAFYNGGYAAKSVWATEHSVALSFGPGEGELKYLNHILDVVPDDQILSVVIDTYDPHGFIRNIAGDLDIITRIQEKTGRVVFRPDSGNPLIVPLDIIELLGEIYGYRHNAAGYKTLNHNVGVLQGDGMNEDSIVELYKLLTDRGWAASNLVTGSGGGLLVEGLSRDTHRFAMKPSVGLIGEEIINFAKRPLTDPTKVSKSGYMKVHKGYNGRYQTFTSATTSAGSFNAYVDSMRILYDHGQYNPESFATIQARFEQHLSLLTAGVI